MNRYKREIAKIIVFAMTHTSFICAMLTPLFKDAGFSAIEFSTLFMIKKASRLLFDIPFGFLFDRFSPRFVFFIGRLFKLFSFLLLLLEANFLNIALAMVCDGISYSAMYGKINVLIFNVLKSVEKKELFPRVYSVYYGIVDISLAIVQITAGFLFKKGGYNLVLKMSIIMWFIAFFTLFIIPNPKINRNKNLNISSEIKRLVIDLRFVFLSKKYFKIVVFFYAFINFFAWHFGPMVSLIFLDMGYNPFELAVIGSVCKLVPIFGVVLTFKVNYIPIRKMTYIIIPIIIFITVSAFSYNRYLLIFSILLPLLFYALLEGNMEKFIDNEAHRRVRATVSSVNSVITTIFSVVITMFFGLLGDLFSIKYAFMIISFISLLFIIIISGFILKYFKQDSV